MTLAWGIAATGRIARTVGSIAAKHPDMRVAAVGSRDLARARELADDLGARSAHGSYEALVHDPDVQAVYVATPHPQHAAVVEAALLAGKAVLCEKPMTADLTETERLVELSRSTGSFLMEAVWTRFNPLVAHLRELVADGALGDLRSVTASFGFDPPYDPHGRLWSAELGGGALLDLGVYTVDLARLLLGDPDTVEATGSAAQTGVDAESVLSLGWRSGARALLTQSLVARLPGTALVVGSRGWAELGPSFHAPTRLVVHVRGGEREEHAVDDRQIGYLGELEEVARCLADGRRESEVMPLADSVGTMRVLDTARRLMGTA
jgi:predicted dehydrogenase